MLDGYSTQDWVGLAAVGYAIAMRNRLQLFPRFGLAPGAIRNRVRGTPALLPQRRGRTDCLADNFSKKDVCRPLKKSERPCLEIAR